MQLLESYSASSAFSIVFILLLSYNIYEISQMALRLERMLSQDNKEASPRISRQPIAWIEGEGVQPLRTYLRHVADVFKTMGYNVTSGHIPADWDVLWTHEYSLKKEKYDTSIREAKPHQLVNHIAGSGFYTSKVWLATSQSINGIPQSFKLPKQKKELLAYADQHPHTMWVQKDNTHRNIKVQELKAMDLDKENSFVQEFVDNPLLIDNRKFDIGIYTVITSIHPLKVYVYEGDALIRFCAEDYLPFNSTRLDKYVVGDDYTPIWEIPSLRRLFTEQKLGWRASFDAYLQTKSTEPSKIWTQIHKIIAEVFRNQQPRMLAALRTMSSEASFFELSRFDFIVDEQLNVFLMEANMSPNLSSEHFSQNQVLYEQVLYNVFSLVGLASSLTNRQRREMNDARHSRESIVPDSEIYLPLAECIEGGCPSCDRPVCQLCAHCMSSTTATILRQTIFEHVNRRNMRMLTISYDTQKPATKEDNLLRIWRQAKCEADVSWC